MIKKILIPNYDKLSSKQKALTKKWVKSLLRVKAINEELLETFSSTSQGIHSELRDTSFEFKLVDSSLSSEGISIEEIIPSLLLKKEEDPVKGVCEYLCSFTDNPAECIKKYC
jgi:hypothetical protein